MEKPRILQCLSKHLSPLQTKQKREKREKAKEGKWKLFLAYRLWQ